VISIGAWCDNKWEWLFNWRGSSFEWEKPILRRFFASGIKLASEDGLRGCMGLEW